MRQQAYILRENWEKEILNLFNRVFNIQHHRINSFK